MEEFPSHLPALGKRIRFVVVGAPWLAGRSETVEAVVRSRAFTTPPEELTLVTSHPEYKTLTSSTGYLWKCMTRSREVVQILQFEVVD